MAIDQMPVIRLEVERMKHSMLMALSSYQVRLSEELNAAVEAFCRPENIERIMTTEVSKVLETAIRGEVESFFRFGDGRAAIREAVERRLRAEYTPEQHEAEK